MPPDVDSATDAAFAAMLSAAAPRARALLRRLCGADAEDVLQEALTKAWRLRANWDPTVAGDGWLLQTAFRTFCDFRARQQRTSTTTLPELAAAPPPDRLELQDEVARVVRSLRPIERDLLLGFHRDGLSIEELAARHHLPANTVKSHLHRARLRLQDEHHGR